MQGQSKEVILVYYGTILLWVSIVGVIWILGKRWERIYPFRERMHSQWQQAFIIAMFYFVSVLLSGRGFNPYGFAIFCQALIGLAIARGIPNFEPLPVIEAVRCRSQITRYLFLFIVIGFTAGILGLFLGGVAMGITQNVFHETPLTEQIRQTFPTDKFQMLFLFLAGGIAEEMLHRLVLLSLIWAVTKRPWLAILLAALVHSGYHFTILNPLHPYFLQFPISQLVSGVVIGILWGYVFIKRGFETVVLAHTVSDWLPMLFLM